MTDTTETSTASTDLRPVLYEHLRKLPLLGDVRANRIIEFLGGDGGAEEAIRQLDERPDTLTKVPGLTVKSAALIARGWKAKRQQLDAAIQHYRRSFES